MKLMQTPAQLDPVSGKAVRVNSTLVLWSSGAAIMNRTLTKCVEQKKVLTAKHYKQWVHNHLPKHKQSGGFDDGRHQDFYQQFDELQDLWRDHINGEQKSATGKAAAAADIRASARGMTDDDLKDVEPAAAPAAAGRQVGHQVRRRRCCSTFDGGKGRPVSGEQASQVGFEASQSRAALTQGLQVLP